MNVAAYESTGVPKVASGWSLHGESDMSDLMHKETGRIFVVNRVGRRVIEMCDGRRTVADIVQGLTREFNKVSVERVSRDVHRFLEEASKRGLIESANI